MSRGLNIFVNIGGKLLPSLNSSATAVEKRFGLMSKRVRVQAAEMKASYRGMMNAASPLLGLAAAGGLMFTAKAAIGDSAELSHQLQMLRNAGRSTKEVAASMAAANRTIQQIPTSTLVDNLRVLNETTMAFGGFQHAAENLTFVQKMSGMMQNLLGDEGGLSKDSAYSLIKALEMRGMGTKQHKGFDSARFQREAGFLYQASIASGGKVTPDEFFNFTKKAAPFVQGFSNRYLYRIAPTLIQEQGGEIAGSQNTAFINTILGKAKNKISTEAWMKLGLLDPKSVVYSKVGPVGFKAGGMKGTDLAMRDPLAWSEQVLVPALKAQGVDVSNTLAIQKALIPLFRNVNANRLATTLVQQQTNTNLHKDEGLINRVPGVDQATNETLRKDPLMAWTAVKASLNNVLSTVFGTSKGDSPVAVALVHIANGINMVAGAFQSYPKLGQGVGALLLGSAGIAGLKVLGVGLKFIFSPLKGIFRLLFLAGGNKIGLVGNILRGLTKGFRFIAPFIGRFGALIFRGLVALAPMVMEGLAGAFALLSNPIGWAIILGGVALALGYYFRGPLMAAWTKGWNALKSWVLSVDWKGIGMSIANFLTFGLAGKFANAISNLKNSVPNAANTGMNSTHAMAGARANGGPFLARRAYLVGERGPEIATFGHSGRIIPNHHIAAMAGGPRHYRPGRAAPLVGELHVHGGNGSPAEIEHAVHRALKRLANDQAALLSD